MGFPTGGVTVTGSAPPAGAGLGASGCPFTCSWLDTVTLSLIVFAPLESANKRGSRVGTGVCGGVGSAFEVVGGGL